MPSLVIDDVTKHYGAFRAIKGVSFSVERGEFIVMVGPSGCGKSTLLRIIAGLEPITAGRVVINDRDVTHLEPADRGVAMVFQNYALYPHMNVAQNMGFGLKMSGRPKRRGRGRGAARRRDPSHHRASRQAAEGAVRRPEAARRDRPRHHARARGLPVRRAAVQSRRRAPVADARRAFAACIRSSRRR